MVTGQRLNLNVALAGSNYVIVGNIQILKKTKLTVFPNGN